jgi:transposase
VRDLVCAAHRDSWQYLPQEPGFGSGMTCRRRLVARNEAGVWEKLRQLLLNKLQSRTGWTGRGR